MVYYLMKMNRNVLGYFIIFHDIIRDIWFCNTRVVFRLIINVLCLYGTFFKYISALH